MSKEMTISEDYLRELIDFVSSSLVGKILKRFEILNDKEAIKSSTKELIYEEFRNFRNLIIAYNKGAHITQFQFKTKTDNLTPNKE